MKRFPDFWRNTRKLLHFFAQRDMEQEIVEATIVQNPREMGIRAMDVMYQLFEEGLGEVEDQYVDVMVVDKENVQDVSYIRREDIPWQLY